MKFNINLLSSLISETLMLKKLHLKTTSLSCVLVPLCAFYVLLSGLDCFIFLSSTIWEIMYLFYLHLNIWANRMQNNTLQLIPCMQENFIFQEYLFNIGAIALIWLKVWAWMLWVFMYFGIIIKSKKESLISKQKVETSLTFYNFVKKKIWKYFWDLVLTFVLNGTSEDYPQDY